MRKYWLYLESFTFVFKGKQGYLFFNSISNHSFLISSQVQYYNFIEQLLDAEQMYCIEISENEIDKYDLRPFIKRLRETYTGDLLSKQLISTKPIALYPKLSIMKSVERLKLHPENSVGQSLLNYLHELNIYITGYCTLDCLTCKTNEKQVTTCIKNSTELDLVLLKKLLHNTQPTGLYKINVLGGDIFSYTQLKELCLILIDLPYQTKLFNNYKNILQNSEKVSNIPTNSTFCILIPGSFSKEELVESLAVLERNKLNFELNFHINTEVQYFDALSFCEKKMIERYSIFPIFTGSNEDFFKQFVFLDNESILSLPSSKKDIFSRMSLNTNDFGKLNLMSNGDVYANINRCELGNIKNSSLYEILYSEILNGESWLSIRNQEPCNHCVYQWLCPSPSNYEITIGKPNLCHVM